MTNFDTFSAIPQFAPFARNRCKALMVMATGSGKTRTVIALCNCCSNTVGCGISCFWTTGTVW